MSYPKRKKNLNVTQGCQSHSEGLDKPLTKGPRKWLKMNKLYKCQQATKG